MNNFIRTTLAIGSSAILARSLPAQKPAFFDPLSGWAAVFECMQCTLHIDKNLTWADFGTEPAARKNIGPILAGDALVAVDGRLITTSGAGYTLATINTPGAPARQLTVRRNGRLVDFLVPQNIRISFDADGHPTFANRGDSITVVAKWAHDSQVARGYREGGEASGPSAGVNASALETALKFMTSRRAPSAGSRNRSSTAGLSEMAIIDSNPPAAAYFQTDTSAASRAKVRYAAANPTAQLDDALSSSKPDNGEPVEMNRFVTYKWLGFELDCSRCSMDGLNHVRKDGIVRYTEPPYIKSIDGGQALVAGFHKGDRIITIDGINMASEAGTRRFGTMRPGEEVVFLVRRNVAKRGQEFQEGYELVRYRIPPRPEE